MATGYFDYDRFTLNEADIFSKALGKKNLPMQHCASTRKPNQLFRGGPDPRPRRTFVMFTSFSQKFFARLTRGA